MTVGAEDLQVRNFIIQVIAVNVLHLEWRRLAAPLGKIALFALGLLQA
jgi:hypothetical protein